jgi:hypothetical protein
MSDPYVDILSGTNAPILLAVVSGCVFSIVCSRGCVGGFICASIFAREPSHFLRVSRAATCLGQGDPPPRLVATQTHETKGTTTHVHTQQRERGRAGARTHTWGLAPKPPESSRSFRAVRVIMRLPLHEPARHSGRMQEGAIGPNLV